MHHQLTLYMRTRNIDVLCLQETKVKRTSYYLVDSYTFYTFSSCDSAQREHYGMGFVLSPLARKALLRMLPGTSRVAGLSLHTGAGELSLLNSYAPHNLHDPEAKQAHYDELSALVTQVEHKGPYLILGDFNARIHGRLIDEDQVLGPHLYGKGVSSIGGSEDNRSLLMKFCHQHQLLVSNTWFQHPSSKQVTYKEVGTSYLPPAGTDWDPQLYAQLDFCLAPRRWKNVVRDVFSDPWANVDSDHFPLLIRIKPALGARSFAPQRPRWDFSRASQNAQNAFNSYIVSELSALPDDVDTDTHWHRLREVYVNAMTAHIPRHIWTPRKPWISAHTLGLIHHRGILRTQGDLSLVAQCNKDIKRSARRDKKTWLDDRIQHSEWEPIKELRKPFSAKVVHLDPPPGLLVPPDPSASEIFAAHLEQRQWAPAAEQGVEGIRSEPVCTEPPLINEGPFSMAELITAIKHLKAGKSAGSDNIPNELWKALSAEGLTSLLTFFQYCWDHGTSPSSWKHSLVVGIFKKGSHYDPGNYRPISLLQTCYKLYARLIAARLYAGSEPHLRDNQYGFRAGRSTNDAVFLVRRMQDLIDGKRNQALYTLFIDWHKAFDAIKPAALHLALTRLRVPAHTCNVIRELTACPHFQVAMSRELSTTRQQASGIRQGCTLSPLLFIAMQTVLFHDVQKIFLEEHPLATTPKLPLFDIEYADDTVLITRTRDHMQSLLHTVQREAARYNLFLNTGKCKLILHNTEASISFLDGSQVIRVPSTTYLGVRIDEHGKPGPEVTKRIGECQQVFKQLIRVWKHARISIARKLRIYYACIVSKLSYGFCTVWLTEKQNHLLDSFHIRCLRSIAGIPSTWGATVTGQDRTPNEEVRSHLGMLYLSDELKLQQLQLLGHVLRRPTNHPARVLCFDRFLQPQLLGGPYRAGARRLKWSEQVLHLATTIIHDHYFQGAEAGVGERRLKTKLLEVSQNRHEWSSLLQRVRSSWRRPRDAHGDPRP